MSRHMTVGAQDEDGTQWRRCPSCGDSPKNKNKAHLMVDTKGSTYCFKCGYSAQLDIGALIDIALGAKSVDEAIDEEIELEERGGKEQRRFSLLETYDDADDRADAFEMRDQHGKRIGWHVRYPGKQFKNEGERGIGYLTRNLQSTQRKPLTVVEGPYDVVEPSYVCTFGTMNAGNLSRFFRMQHVWLFPDPDVIDTEMKRARFADKVIRPALDAMVFVMGVVVGNDDPDKATVMQELTAEEALDRWSTSLTRAHSPIHLAIELG